MINWQNEGGLYIGRLGVLIVATVRKSGLVWRWQIVGGSWGFAASPHAAMSMAEVSR
jgi:hypothetical protein